MAAAAVQTYTPAAYDHHAVDAMTDVDVAAQRLQELNGLDHMKSCIRYIPLHEMASLGLLTWLL